MKKNIVAFSKRFFDIKITKYHQTIIKAIEKGDNIKLIKHRRGGIQTTMNILLKRIMEKKDAIIIFTNKDGVEKELSMEEKEKFINKHLFGIMTCLAFRVGIPVKGDGGEYFFKNHF